MYYIDKIKLHLSNWWYYFLEHLVRFIFLSFIMAGLCYGFSKLPIYNIYDEYGQLTDQHVLIFGITLENWSIFFTIIGLVLTAIWGIYQYDKSKKLKQQEKASDIANDFADNLIEKMGLISDTLMQSPDIQTLVKKIVTSQKLNNFTTMEIIDILNDNNCFKVFESTIRSESTQKIYENFLNERYNQREQEKFDSRFPLLVENTLNHLEARCINISSQAAGSQFIYNSLHQSFLYTIEVLAIKISANNNNNVDKYYTHIIQVYNMWNTQKQRDIKRLKKTKKKIDKLNSKVGKTIAKLLNKKNGTV